MVPGGVLREYDSSTLKLLTNPELLEMSQYPLGKAARELKRDPDTRIWSRELAGGSRAPGFFNLSSGVKMVTIAAGSPGLGAHVAAWICGCTWPSR